MFVCSVVVSQELFVGSGGVVGVGAKGSISVIDVTVDPGGSLVLYSDGANSSSLLVNGTSVGSVTYERHVPNTDWHIFSSPVNSQSINSFATNLANDIVVSSPKYAIGEYINTNTAGQRWAYFTTTTSPGAGSFTSGKGYVFKRNSTGVFSFVGGVASSDVALTMNTASGVHNWHAVGNPFTAFLPGNANASATNVLGQNIAKLDAAYSALYLWDGSAYIPINQLSSSLYLAPGQAFMVRAKDASEIFTFSKNLTSHQSGTTKLYKGASLAGIRLELKESSNIKTTSIKFLEGATLGLDIGFDAGAYQEDTPSFAINSRLVENGNNIDFALQALPNDSFEGLEVPLSVYAGAGKTIYIHAVPESLPEGLNIFIEDRQFNTFTKVNETTGFEVNLSESVSGIGRFFLRTSSNSVLSVEEIPLSDVNIFTTDTNLLMVSGIDQGKKALITLYSLLGKEMFLNRFVAKGDEVIPISRKISSGVYIVQLSIEGNVILSKKIFLK